MSHELRTPLNAILGFAQLLESADPPPSGPQKRSIDQILKAGWYLLELINEILDLALIESGKLTLSNEPVSLAEVMSECQAMVEPQARSRGIQMAFPVRPEEGTGIGLVVTKRLVDLMGATMGADSTVGEGSIFWCEFKLASAPQFAAAAAGDVEVARPAFARHAATHAALRRGQPGQPGSGRAADRAPRRPAHDERR